MKKIVFCILLFNVSVSFGQENIDDTNIGFFSAKKAVNSLVKVTLVGKRKQKIEVPGLITEDPKGDLQVLTGFPVFNGFFESGQSIVIVNGAGRRFSVKGIKQIAPLYHLISLSVEGDLTEQGRFPPVKVAQSFKENEPLFYTVPSGFWFKVKRVQKTLSFPRRLDFLTDSSLTVLSQQPVGGTFIMNQRGEVVSFAATGMNMALFGLPLDTLRVFLEVPMDNDVPLIYTTIPDDLRPNLSYLKPFILSFPTETCFPFLQGCLAKAKQTLYRQAQEGDSQDSYQLMMFTGAQFPIFERFMRSIGIDDSLRIREEWEGFLKSSALWDPTYYLYHNEMETKNTSGNQGLNRFSVEAVDNVVFFPFQGEGSPNGNTKFKEYVKSLIQTSDVKKLALREHPHFQNVMGFMSFEIGDLQSALYWFNKSVDNGYLPALFNKSVLTLIASIQTLLKLAKDNDFALAKKMLGLLRWDLSETENFLEQYNEDQPSPHLPKAGYSKRLLSWWQKKWQRKPSSVEEDMHLTNYESSKTFHDSLAELTTGLGQLKSLAEQGYEPAKQLRDNFEEKLRIQIPSYFLSEELDQECLIAFKTYFIPTKKNSR